MRFYVGCHQVSDARRFPYSFVSVRRLVDRVSDFEVGRWVMDSGAFAQVSVCGEHELSVADYAAQIRRWSRCGTLEAAVAQDYMCESFVLERAGRTVGDHQAMTIERYDALLAADPCVYVMPVLQGSCPWEYVDHLRQYGKRLWPGQWVGVGSVCKLNSEPGAVRARLDAIRAVRPDLRLHGFGLKLTALQDDGVRRSLESADSMAWSYRARFAVGRSGNDWREGERYRQRVVSGPVQTVLL